MAIPTSPSVVVLENDVSIYTPNVNSSVVGIVGFADKGPTNKATLITSQENLLKNFGRPNTDMPGQGLEGSLEILEATNQLYFVRAADESAAAASAVIPLGAAPAAFVSGNWDPVAPSSLYYQVNDNQGVFSTSGLVVIPASTTTHNTRRKVLFNAFNPELTDDQPLIAYESAAAAGAFVLASRFAGSGATLRLSSTVGVDGNEGLRFQPIRANGAVSAVNNGITGQVPEAGDVTIRGFDISSIGLVAYSLYPGTAYNISGLRDGSTQGISVEVTNRSVLDRFVVNSDGAQAEVFTGELASVSADSFERLLTNDELNAKSDYVYVNAASIPVAETDYASFPNVWGDTLPVAVGIAGSGEVAVADALTPRFVKPIEGTYNFTSGKSGYTGSGISALKGSATNKTGIHALNDDSLNISLAAVPGISDDAVQNELVTLAESSKNFLALVSPPLAVGKVQDATDWINGKGTRTAALNSSYAAAYWPWVQVFNYFAGAEEWYDPAIFAARQCVFTDSVSEPWFAPAGINRGRLTKPTDTETILNQGDKDSLYANSLNPIVKDPAEGIVIFGQRTTQRKPSALDRVNVRRLMIFIRKTLLQLGKPFQFEPNDQFTWEQVKANLDPFIGDLLARRAIVEGAVICDSTTNTPLRVDRNELWCSVTIKPTKAAETIVFEVNLTSQSATING